MKKTVTRRKDLKFAGLTLKSRRQPILHVDATPDKDYPLRILKAYRQNCECEWTSTQSSKLVDALNKMHRERRRLLDKAIQILEWALRPARFLREGEDDD